MKRGVPRGERVSGRLRVVGRRRRRGGDKRRRRASRRPRLGLLRGDLGGAIGRRVRLGLGRRLSHGREPPRRGFIEARRAEYALGSPAEPTERAEFDDFLDRFRLRHLLARALQQQVVVGDVGEVVDETRRVVVRRVPERPLHVIHRPFVRVGSVVRGERIAGRRRADGGASRVSRRAVTGPSLQQRRERRRRPIARRSRRLGPPGVDCLWVGAGGRGRRDGELVDGRRGFDGGGYRARHQRTLRPRLVVQTLLLVNLPPSSLHDPLHALPRLVVTLAVHSLERPEQRRVLAGAHPRPVFGPGRADVFTVGRGVGRVRH